ncbi:MAG: ABC transporter permease [Thermotogota bacterium]
MIQLRAYWSILIKDMKTYYLKPPNISWGIVFPVAWTLMFLIRSQTDVDIKSILPGVMAMSILFGTTSMLAVTITFEKKHRSFERLLLSPISLNLLMLAKTSGAILFGIVNAFIPVLFAAFIMDLGGINWLLVFTGVLLISITSTFLGLFIAVSAKEVFEAQTYSNFFRFPMIFLCGLFFPITDIPVLIRPLSYLLPLTYGADILKYQINNEGLFAQWVNFLLLFVFAAFLFMLSIKSIKKKWIY